ncbi:hypothetical protein POSPLADRAFT_1063249 [Postia placenta MAD-698-R-SB12]|uniref:Uncharacterized protein n=1 Tax=Postia placenta MAD-698-R-SB12 TaxID=670580 RepID=A0A1X6MHN1_9APHY|nr:hypothetical protein POSPLADRAFT_1063249 [Postia placenta MAD-698-R-SB12]OSX55931.1 hypothetical protein POSPLADRAFT_1063249 [Postia placenta MAD-698-R-SB12]
MGAKAGAIIAPRQRPSGGWLRRLGQNRRVSRATCECQCESREECARKERRAARTTTRADTRAAGQKTEPGVTALVPPTSSLHTCRDVTSPIEGASRGRPARRGGSLVASSPDTPCRAQRMHPAGHHDVAAHTGPSSGSRDSSPPCIYPPSVHARRLRSQWQALQSSCAFSSFHDRKCPNPQTIVQWRPAFTPLRSSLNGDAFVSSLLTIYQ